MVNKLYHSAKRANSQPSSILSFATAHNASMLAKLNLIALSPRFTVQFDGSESATMPILFPDGFYIAADYGFIRTADDSGELYTGLAARDFSASVLFDIPVQRLYARAFKPTREQSLALVDLYMGEGN